jgi:hypothetical protein
MSNKIKNAIKSAHTELILDGILDKSSRYSIRIRKDYDTACWSFRPPHHIFVGDGVLKNVREGVHKDKDYYIASYLHHEVGHSLFTERDLKSINSCLRSKGMGFKMFNLFEDARIEHLMRKKTGRPFRWFDYEDAKKIDMEKPLSQFFFLIQSEYSWKEKTEEKVYVDEHVIGFYKEAIECEDTWAVIDVMEKWLEVFPQSKDEIAEEMETIGFGSESDLSQSLQLQDNDDKLSELLSGSADINEKEEKRENNKGEKNKGGKDPRKDDHGEPLEEFSSYDYTRTYKSVEIDSRLIGRLLPRLQSIFRGRVVKTNTARPSKRLSIKGLTSDSDKIYRRNTQIAPATKKFNLIIDCSGSMDGDPLSGAASIAVMFGSLASMGYVEGSVVLSSTSGYQTFRLPLSQKRIEEVFHTHGGEGFSNTFSAVKPLMKDADVNFIITDGNISDGALDKHKMTSEGIYTFGVYVGDPEYCQLDRWFHRGVAKETLTAVVDELRRQILVKPL